MKLDLSFTGQIIATNHGRGLARVPFYGRLRLVKQEGTDTIDAVWNLDPRSARTRTHSADEILTHVNYHRLSVEWILDTHPHADHFMAAAYLKQKLGAPQAMCLRSPRFWGGETRVGLRPVQLADPRS